MIKRKSVRERQTASKNPRCVECIHFCDGPPRALLLTDNHLFVAGMDCHLHYFTNGEHFSHDVKAPIRSLAFLEPKGVLVCGVTNGIEVFQVVEGEVVYHDYCRMNCDGKVRSLAFTRKTFYLCASAGSTILVFRDWQLYKELDAHKAEISVLFIDANDMLFSASLDGTINVWEVEKDFECIYSFSLSKLQEETDGFPALAIAPEGYIISGTISGAIDTWTAKDHKRIVDESEAGAVASLNVNNKTHLFVGRQNGDIEVRERATGSLLFTLEAHNGIVNSVQVHRGMLFSVSEDSSLRIWMTKDEPQLCEQFFGSIPKSTRNSQSMSPIGRKQQINKEEEQLSIEECPICLDALIYKRAFTTACGHLFHFNCIKETVDKGMTGGRCPICRYKFEDPQKLFDKFTKSEKKVEGRIKSILDDIVLNVKRSDAGEKRREAQLCVFTIPLDVTEQELVNFFNNTMLKTFGITGNPVTKASIKKRVGQIWFKHPEYANTMLALDKIQFKRQTLTIRRATPPQEQNEIKKKRNSLITC